MKEFWEEQALKYGAEVSAVNFDPIQEELTTKLINSLVPNGVEVADLGCGNGRTVFDLAASRPQGRFVGYDFAENMVRVAEDKRRSLASTNVQFFCFDATSGNLPADATSAFDLVIGKRLLINIKGASKGAALKNIYSLLKPDGTYLMCECFLTPLQRINDIRSALDLDPIVVRSFNEYLADEFLDEVCELFVIERTIDHASLYYFVSRVFNAALSRGTPDYHSPINELARKVISAGIQPMSGYSPEVCYVLKKRSDVGDRDGRKDG